MLPDRRARPARPRPRPARDRRRARRPDPRPAGLAGPADAHRRPVGRRSTAPRSRSIQLRVGGQAARLVDETLPPPVRRASARRRRARRVREGAADRAGRPRHRRGVGAARRARLVDPRLHEPGRDRHPGAARRRPPGDRAVQRRDRVPAPVRASGSASTPEPGRSSTTSGSTTCRGSGRSGSTASTGCRSSSTTGDAAVTLHGDFAARARAGARRDPVLLPALLLRDRRRRSREQRDGRDAGRGRDRDRARAARAVPRPDARPQAGAARAARRRVLQRGRGGAHRVAPHRRRRDPRRRRPQRRRDPGPAATTPSSRLPARIDRDGAHAAPDGAAGARDARPRPAREGVRAARRSRRRSRATTRSRSGRCSPTRSSPRPTAAQRLRDAIIEANLRYLPRFVASAGADRRSSAPRATRPPRRSESTWSSGHRPGLRVRHTCPYPWDRPAVTGDVGDHPVGVRIGAGNDGGALIRLPDTRSDRKRHVWLAKAPTTAKWQGQHDRCRDHDPPPILHVPSTALSERRALT